MRGTLTHAVHVVDEPPGRRVPKGGGLDHKPALAGKVAAPNGHKLAGKDPAQKAGVQEVQDLLPPPGDWRDLEDLTDFGQKFREVTGSYLSQHTVQDWIAFSRWVQRGVTVHYLKRHIELPFSAMGYTHGLDSLDPHPYFWAVASGGGVCPGTTSYHRSQARERFMAQYAKYWDLSTWAAARAQGFRLVRIVVSLLPGEKIPSRPREARGKR